MIALAGQTIPRAEYEIIVVDDGSIDQTGEVARRYGAVVLKQCNSGPAVARNNGIAAASGEIVLFTDADCAPSPDWIEQMVASLSDQCIVGVKGVYRTRQQSWVARFIQLEYQDRYDHTARSDYVDFIDTYAAGYRREVLVESGGFDPSFPLASTEDQELSFRLAEAGHKMVFNPRAIVYHRHPESWGRYARRKYKIGYWKTLVLRLHPGKAWRDTHTPWNLKLQLVLAALTAPLAFLSLLHSVYLWLLGPVLAAFAASTVPFLVKAWRLDPVIACFSLPALYVRAWSLGLGLVAGYADALLRRGPRNVPAS